MKKRISVSTAILLIAICIGIGAPARAFQTPTPKKEKHPDIRKAIAACELAATDLEDAAHDFCGHREAALDADLAAIAQLELALACDPNAANPQAAAVALSAARTALSAAVTASAKKEKHPYIRKALAALNLAAVDLEDAAHDFCGHREAALDAVNAAITQLELAIACDPQS